MEGFEIRPVIEEGRTVIGVEGKLDSTNSTEFEKALNMIMGTNEGALVLDFSGLDYISSAGLRVILKLARVLKDDFSIVNVPQSVYSIFEMTGFTKILKVEKAKRQISIEGSELIGQGASGKIYRLDDETIVKVFYPNVPDRVIQRERECSHQAFLYGIPTAISFDVVEVGDCRGIVYELLDSKTLARQIMDDPDNFDMYMQEYVALLKKVHTTRVSDDTFLQLKDIYSGYIKQLDKWYTPEELGRLELLLDSIPERSTLLHGDYHAKNVMVVNGELTLIDMGDMSIGNPVYDLSSLANAYSFLVKAAPQMSEYFVGLPAETAARVWERLLPLYFETTDKDLLAKLDNLLLFYGGLKYAFAPVMGVITEEKRAEMIAARVRNSILANIESMTAEAELLWEYL